LARLSSPARHQKKSYKSKKYSGGRRWGATTDAAEIKRNWKRWPKANIGVATGVESGFFVPDIDSDEGHGVNGFASLAALEKEHGALPPTLQARTPSGGAHYFFKHPGNGIKIKCSTSELGDGIDIKGDGGMVLLPPSVKANGSAYVWSNDLEIADAPQWLLDLVVEHPREKKRSDRTSDAKLLEAAIAVIPNDDLDWDNWNRIGMAIWAATQGSDSGRELFHLFSRKSAKYDAKTVDQKWEQITGSPPDQIGTGTLFFLAGQADPRWRNKVNNKGVSLDDFHAYLPAHNYIFAPTLEPWPASSVNACIAPIPNGFNANGEQQWIAASEWIDQHQPVHQMTWAPGEPMLINDRLIADGGWIMRDGVTCFNLYRPPITMPGDPTKVEPWLDLLHTIYPNDCDHIIAWLAHRVQRPQEKINHAIVLGGSPGIGKDSLLAAVRYAIGEWNFKEVSPIQLLGRFNGFIKSVILRVSEARDLGDINRYQFYDHMKVYCASPPEVLRCDEKNLREHSVLNVCPPIITSNYKTDGIYLPADDRRHFVAWSEMKKENFTKQYWDDLWGWYERNDNEGFRNVAAYLAIYSLANFNAKAPPPLTPAFWAIVDANRAPEDAELADVLDKMKNPKATTLDKIRDHATGEIVDWLEDRKNRRLIPHRLEKCGYVPVRNDDAKDGLWKITGARQVVYACAALDLADRLKAAQELQKELNRPKPPKPADDQQFKIF
jgi:bifunctional DNA primase/polymerase-like protein/primase-like protein